MRSLTKYARYCRAFRNLDCVGSAADEPRVGLRSINVFRHRRSATENPATSGTHCQPYARFTDCVTPSSLWIKWRRRSADFWACEQRIHSPMMQMAIYSLVSAQEVHDSQKAQPVGNSKAQGWRRDLWPQSDARPKGRCTATSPPAQLRPCCGACNKRKASEPYKMGTILNTVTVGPRCPTEA